MSLFRYLSAVATSLFVRLACRLETQQRAESLCELLSLLRLWMTLRVPLSPQPVGRKPPSCWSLHFSLLYLSEEAVWSYVRPRPKVQGKHISG